VSPRAQLVKSTTTNDHFYFVLCNLVPIIYSQYWYLFVEYLIQDCLTLDSERAMTSRARRSVCVRQQIRMRGVL